MGLPNKQIGWSNESNLLWEILRQVTALDKNINGSGSIPNQDNIPTPLVFKLSDIGAANFDDDVPAKLATHLATLNYTVSEIQNMVFEVNDEIDYNFDMTAPDWNFIDAAEFKAYLVSNGNPSGIIVEDYSISDGRVRCVISDTTVLYLESSTVTEVLICNIEGLEAIGLTESVDLSTFNVSVLPDTLETLSLGTCSLSTLNTGLILPTSLNNISFTENDFTTASYEGLEGWANMQPDGTATINFESNINSPSGTDFATILTSKGYNLIF